MKKLGKKVTEEQTQKVTKKRDQNYGGTKLEGSEETREESYGETKLESREQS